MAEQKMKCIICGWIYDPAVGIPGKGVKPGAPFEELPADFRCPKCGAARKWFQPVT
ncbi:MAG: rubredoxin [Euryarchaeota archaeon]|nr:rubredoxin [Euryarchaeota archaeon]